jgi:hypothetical protein
MSGSSVFRAVAHCFRTLSLVVGDLVRLASLAARSHSALAAENLFLRKQLALFQERKIKPRRADDSTRWMMVTVSRMFPWRDAVVNVKADTLLRWHRKGLRLFWRWKSKPTGRPRLPRDLRDLIRKMAAENPIWGEERIANELKMKLGIRVSPRTVGKYLSNGGPRREPDPKQRWLTFVRNHAKAIVACDFFVVVTASFRTLYVFVIMELGTRRRRQSHPADPKCIPLLPPFIVLDLVRHRLPLALFRTFVYPFLGSLNAKDGVTSIRRSYTPQEMRCVVDTALDGSGADVRHTVAPFCIRQVVDISW